MSYTGIKKVISGGQTGADQGGLMAAWQRGIPTGGWAPYDYRTNLGPNPILEVLGLNVTAARSYQERTCRNVEEADVTLIFGYNLSSPGSSLTADLADKAAKPYFTFEFPLGRDADSKEVAMVEKAVAFILHHQPEVVNVAGNRDTDANNPNFIATRRIFGLIFDLVKQRILDGV